MESSLADPSGDLPPDRFWWRRRPLPWIVVSYVLIAVVALAPSIRPGRTLVAADLVTIVSPYSAVPEHPEPHNLHLTDVPYQFFPWFRFVAGGLRSGHLPSWNPTVLGGMPVTPNGYFGTSYPPFFLAAFFSPFDAYNLLIVLHLIVAALGIYAFSRVLGARRVAAWVAGVLTFAAAFWIHWSTHLLHLVAFAGLPWALAATHLLIVAPSRKRVAALAVVFGAWWLGGNPQFVYDGMLVVGSYAVALLVWQRVKAGGQLFRPAIAVAGALGLGAALAAPLLLPTAAFSGEVLRKGEVAPTDHVPLSEAIRVLVPDATGNPVDRVFYGSNDELRMDSPFVGITAVVLCGAAVAGWRRDWRPLLLVGVAAVLLLAYTSAVHGPLHDFLPGYDRFRAVPHRWLSVLPALVLPLAALGLHDLLARERGARIGVLATAGASLVAVVVWLLVQNTRADAPMEFFAKRGGLAIAVLTVTMVVVGLGVITRFPAVALALALVCMAGEIGINTTRWYPRVKETNAYPPTDVARIAGERGGRLVRVGDQSSFPSFAPDLPMAYGLNDAQGVVSLFPEDVDRYLRLIDDYGQYAVALNIAPPLSDGSKLASPLLDVLDVRTVVAAPGEAIPGDYSLVSPGDPSIYARQSPGPAVVVADAAPVSEGEMWRRVAAPGWDPSKTAAVVGLPAPVTGGPGSASPRKAGVDSELWDVEAPAGGFLRVSGNWDEGWSATVDGKQSEVYLSDGIFRGVVVPPGQHVVRFSYRNGPEHVGRMIAAAALLIVLAMCVPFPRRRDKADAP